MVWSYMFFILQLCSTPGYALDWGALLLCRDDSGTHMPAAVGQEWLHFNTSTRSFDDLRCVKNAVPCQTHPSPVFGGDGTSAVELLPGLDLRVEMFSQSAS